MGLAVARQGRSLRRLSVALFLTQEIENLKMFYFMFFFSKLVAPTNIRRTQQRLFNSSYRI
jgi:hypothetical protein